MRFNDDDDDDGDEEKEEEEYPRRQGAFNCNESEAALTFAPLL